MAIIEGRREDLSVLVADLSLNTHECAKKVFKDWTMYHAFNTEEASTLFRKYRPSVVIVEHDDDFNGLSLIRKHWNSIAGYWYLLTDSNIAQNKVREEYPKMGILNKEFMTASFWHVRDRHEAERLATEDPEMIW